MFSVNFGRARVIGSRYHGTAAAETVTRRTTRPARRRHGARVARVHRVARLARLAARREVDRNDAQRGMREREAPAVAHARLPAIVCDALLSCGRPAHDDSRLARAQGRADHNAVRRGLPCRRRCARATVERPRGAATTARKRAPVGRFGCRFGRLGRVSTKACTKNVRNGGVRGVARGTASALGFGCCPRENRSAPDTNRTYDQRFRKPSRRSRIASRSFADFGR